MLLSSESHTARTVRCPNCGSHAGEDCVGRFVCWTRVEAALAERRASKGRR